jgi:hypothetical protein
MRSFLTYLPLRPPHAPSHHLSATVEKIRATPLGAPLSVKIEYSFFTGEERAFFLSLNMLTA